MKKALFLLSVSTIVLLTACGSNTEEKAQQDTQAKVDSVQEQKNLDSLFNVAGKNMDTVKAGPEKK
jgi:protein involved in sex pheromone biosynthesis